MHLFFLLLLVSCNDLAEREAEIATEMREELFEPSPAQPRLPCPPALSFLSPLKAKKTLLISSPRDDGPSANLSLSLTPPLSAKKRGSSLYSSRRGHCITTLGTMSQADLQFNAHIPYMVVRHTVVYPNALTRHIQSDQIGAYYTP